MGGGGRDEAKFIRKFVFELMVLILDGNSEIGAHVLSKIGNLICLEHLFRSTTDTYLTDIFGKGMIILACAT